MYEEIKNAARTAVLELIEVAGLREGDVMVIGCSSSEIMGDTIGKGSTFEAAEAVFSAIYPELKMRGIFLAAQCCEHLNRAIITERACAEKYGLEPDCVIPKPKAGGSPQIMRPLSPPLRLSIFAHTPVWISAAH